MNEETTRKPGKRRENRIAAVQFLYLLQSHGPDSGEMVSDLLHSFFEAAEHPREHYQFAEELIQGYLVHREEIDGAIRELATNWDFNRIARVDLSILRVAAFELLHRADIPPVVTINEAVDIGKAYSSDDSRRFINGILDRLSSRLDRDLRTAEG